MSDAPSDRAAKPQEAQPAPKVRYPTNHVVAVLDTEVALLEAVEALTGGGFLDSEIHVTCGKAEADRLHASTGRVGLSWLAIRIAQRLGIEDDEMELKTHYEQAMRDGKFVLRVPALSEARKDRAAEILREHGAHSINFLGRFMIEELPPSKP